jgi:mediator of RNA polymerase II transcription subunit 25
MPNVKNTKINNQIPDSASCGGYLNEIKTNYIHPALEYFCNGLLQEDSTLSLFGIVLFKTSQCGPLSTCCTSYGPFTAQKLIKTIDNLDLTSGKGEQCANLVEGLATALVCFQDLEDERRDTEFTTQKHCILISNSPPYSMPVTECFEYEGKSVEQLAGIFNEKNINLSIISPRKIPILYELYEKSGGDLGLTAKNYSKDPRHLVLLKGFSLKELVHVKFYFF